MSIPLLENTFDIVDQVYEDMCLCFTDIKRHLKSCHLPYREIGPYLKELLRHRDNEEWKQDQVRFIIDWVMESSRNDHVSALCVGKNKIINMSRVFDMCDRQHKLVLTRFIHKVGEQVKTLTESVKVELDHPGLEAATEVVLALRSGMLISMLTDEEKQLMHDTFGEHWQEHYI